MENHIHTCLIFHCHVLPCWNTGCISNMFQYIWKAFISAKACTSQAGQRCAYGPFTVPMKRWPRITNRIVASLYQVFCGRVPVNALAWSHGDWTPWQSWLVAVCCSTISASGAVLHPTWKTKLNQSTVDSTALNDCLGIVALKLPRQTSCQVSW